MKKLYVNINDYQGGSWAIGCVDTIKEWKNRALEWCDSDENYELFNYIKKHKLDTELLDIISEIWSINIVELNKDIVKQIINDFNYDELRWFITDLIDKLEDNYK